MSFWAREEARKAPRSLDRWPCRFQAQEKKVLGPMGRAVYAVAASQHKRAMGCRRISAFDPGAQEPRTVARKPHGTRITATKKAGEERSRVLCLWVATTWRGEGAPRSH